MNQILTLLIGIGFFLLVFLVIRSIVLWYWKIDKQLLNQETQLTLLQKQNQLIEQQTQLIQDFKQQMGNNPNDPNQFPKA